MLGRALVAMVSLAVALAAPAVTVAQEGAAVPAITQSAVAAGPGPTLRVAATDVRQIGADLRFGVRFDSALPDAELDPGHGRIVCVVLDPEAAARRRVCVSSRAGRLAAALAPIDLNGAAIATPRAITGAQVRAAGESLTIRAPARALGVRLGGPVVWRVVLNWRDGGPCESEPDPLACLQITPPSGEQRASTHAATTPPPAVARGPQRSHLRLLATGDSMIQIVDEYLASGLAHRRATVVRSDAHIGSGITRSPLLDWIRKARSQSAGFKPDVTVMALGANDALPLRTGSGAIAACCGRAWIAAYRRRVERMMRSYERGGRSLVYWMTLPVPRSPAFARVFSAVNAAIERAAARVGGGARVIDLVPVLTPGGVFRRAVAFGGRTVDARQPDGIHLSNAGARIAASLVIARLRADHALPRLG